MLKKPVKEESNVKEVYYRGIQCFEESNVLTSIFTEYTNS